MKLYWPVALGCSLIGSFILAPIATSSDWTILPECILPGLLSGTLMAFLFRRVFQRAPMVLLIIFSGPMGMLHLAFFGAIEGFIRQGAEGVYLGLTTAMYWTLLHAILLFIPLAVGANALLKFVADKDVEDLDVRDMFSFPE